MRGNSQVESFANGFSEFSTSSTFLNGICFEIFVQNPQNSPLETSETLSTASSSSYHNFISEASTSSALRTENIRFDLPSERISLKKDDRKFYFQMPCEKEEMEKASKDSPASKGSK